MKETLADIGEKEILNRLQYFMPINQINDDTADLYLSTKQLIINTDILVENVHFNEQTFKPKDIGWKAISVNLSDLASSGTNTILGVTVGLIAPPTTPWKWVEGVYQGMNEALEKFGGKILGGDCSKGNDKIISITAFGERGPLRLHRANAIPGDYLITSGSHGLSRLGLALLNSENFPGKELISTSLSEKAIRTHRRPMPPLKALEAIIKHKPEKTAWRAAGTDSSDGLINAIENLCFSSECQAILFKEKIPKDNEWPKGNQWEQWCLNGGEDFELIASLPESWAKNLLSREPSIKLIGKIKQGAPRIIWDNGDKVKLLKSYEFNHF